MTTTTEYRILLQSNIQGERPAYEDKINNAAAAITPGAFLKLSGANGVVLADSTDPAQGMIALENLWEGSNVAAIDNTYAQNETVRYARVGSGDIVNAILSDGQTIAIGDMLVYGTTDGELVAAGTHDATLIAETVIGFALQALSPSGSNARIQVLIR